MFWLFPLWLAVNDYTIMFAEHAYTLNINQSKGPQQLLQPRMAPGRSDRSFIPGSLGPF